MEAIILFFVILSIPVWLIWNEQQRIKKRATALVRSLKDALVLYDNRKEQLRSNPLDSTNREQFLIAARARSTIEDEIANRFVGRSQLIAAYCPEPIPSPNNYYNEAAIQTDLQIYAGTVVAPDK